MNEMSQMQAKLDLRLRRMYQALGQVRVDGTASVPWFERREGNKITVGFSFANQDEAAVANDLWQFVESIAVLKDHLKAWCTEHNAPFEGDTLINSDRDVAIIHDLWNRDKHADLKQSRSGLWPDLRNIGKGVIVQPNPGESSATLGLSVNPLRLVFGGQSFVGIDAMVVDKNGSGLGTLSSIAERAIDAWEKTLLRAGIPLPPR